MKLYNDYSSYLKERYGTKVFRIALDAGFTCPNRCIYCNIDGSRATYTDPAIPIDTQISERIALLRAAKNAQKFIAYFQAFTNTYADIGRLKAVYDSILPIDDIVGLSIGTRPDCVDSEKLDLIASYVDRYEVWIEYGLQSIHDRTLNAIKRGHTFSDFEDSCKAAASRSIRVCAHVILGLPGESKAMMMETARKLTGMKVDGVKIHLLHILRGSELEALYHEGKITLMSREEYVETACDFLEELSADIVIQRITGEGSREDHIAPAWALDKIVTINMIKDTLAKRKSFQGKAICGSRL